MESRFSLLFCSNFIVQKGHCCKDIMVGVCCGPCAATRLRCEVQQRGPVMNRMSKI